MLNRRVKQLAVGVGHGVIVACAAFVRTENFHNLNVTGQVTSAIQASNPASAASVTGMPSRAKSRKEILMPIARACWTTMMLETLPRMMRLPPKLLASARM